MHTKPDLIPSSVKVKIAIFSLLFLSVIYPADFGSRSTSKPGWGGIAFKSVAFKQVYIVLSNPLYALVIMSLSKGNALAIKRQS